MLLNFGGFKNLPAFFLRYCAHILVGNRGGGVGAPILDLMGMFVVTFRG